MKPPFIASQRLWRLVCPPGYQEACLRPEKLWTLPRDRDDVTVQNINLHGLSQGSCRWERIPNRRDFLADLSNTRLCLTIDAGVGKTTALKQTEYLRQTEGNRDGLAIGLVFAELPAKPDDLLPCLVSKLKNTEQTRAVPDEDLRALVERKIRLGRFTLLVDALDQPAEATAHPKLLCQALRNFLQRYPQTRCVVSGRPFAIRRYWDLFKPEGEWQFIKIDVFTRAETERFVGHKRLHLLEHLEADVIAIPRALEMILGIPDKELPGLRTKSDVYWRAICGMVREAKRDQPKDLDVSESEIWMLYALLAFEMLRRGYRAGLAGVPPGEPVKLFVRQVWDSRERELRVQANLETASQLERKLAHLVSMDENIADGVLEHPAAEVVQYFWRHQTLMDMFAALWITRYAEMEDRRWFAEQPRKEESRELWRLVVEVPADAYEHYAHHYARSLSFLYARPKTGRPRSRFLRTLLTVALRIVTCRRPPWRRTPNLRWTELIYRSWPNMLQLAGYLTAGNWTDADLRQATRRAQQDAWKRVNDGQELLDSQNSARDALLEFLGEFPQVLRGGQGAKKQRIAERLQQGFLRIPPNDSCNRSFREHGVDDEPEIEIAPFQMAATPVTNAQYELFDPTHPESESDYRKYSPTATCPVIYVDWYDAWCFATWAACRLPTADEWEYACRAGTNTVYSFGDDEALLGEYAWYADNSGGRSHPVTKKKPNPWGLYDMHGDVWQWCQDAQAPGRVIRGGGWYVDASFCRASYRHGSDPGARYNGQGFRLARSVSSPSTSR